MDLEEYRALRVEIIVRIVIQNALLGLLVPIFFGSTYLSLGNFNAPVATLAYIGCAGMISLYWIHNGARTLQLKTYLTEVLEPNLRSGGGWEAWHARRRIVGLLGSRWFISTKGVLVGSQLAALALPPILGRQGSDYGPIALIGLLGALATALLLTPPKMSH